MIDFLKTAAIISLVATIVIFVGVFVVIGFFMFITWSFPVAPISVLGVFRFSIAIGLVIGIIISFSYHINK